VRARNLSRGKRLLVAARWTSTIFDGLESIDHSARPYHSLIVDDTSLTSLWKCRRAPLDGIIMGCAIDEMKVKAFSFTEAILTTEERSCSRNLSRM